MTERLIWLDATRALASQLIVLHHLSIYGPVANALSREWPATLGWLDEYGRLAVQVFLVMGGLLAARSLAAAPAPTAGSTLRALGWRYLRLFIPFAAALACVLLAAVPGRAWIDEPWVTQPPDFRTLLAHGLGLFDYFGIEAMSAGAWYVTMDWQLHASLGAVALAATYMPGRWRAHALAGMVVTLAALSLLWANRRPGWDIQPLYFFGSFALGIAAYWCAGAVGHSRRAAGYAIFALAAFALVIEWRLRLAVAVGCAAVFGVALQGGGHRLAALGHCSYGAARAALRRTIGWLGDTAYSLFLIHFAVCIVVNAAFVRLGRGGPVAAGLAFAAAWALSLAAAYALYRLIEVPLARWRYGHVRP